jgi:hypothetical protein
VNLKSFHTWAGIGSSCKSDCHKPFPQRECHLLLSSKCFCSTFFLRKFSKYSENFTCWHFWEISYLRDKYSTHLISTAFNINYCVIENQTNKFFISLTYKQSAVLFYASFVIHPLTSKILLCFRMISKKFSNPRSRPSRRPKFLRRFWSRSSKSTKQSSSDLQSRLSYLNVTVLPTWTHRSKLLS